MATRKRLRLETPQRDAAEAPTNTTLTETLQAVIQEVRLLRVEQARREEEFTATIRRQEEELRRLRGIDFGIQTQLSPSINRASGDPGVRVASGERARVSHEGNADVCGTSVDVVRASEDDAIAGGVNLGARDRNINGAGERSVRASDSAADASDKLGYKLKPDTYDGTTPLQEYFSQLSLIARANRWDDATKTVALASSLRGRARSILETVQDVERLSFAELKTKLELRFGEGYSSQNCYSALTNRRQKFGEDLAALGSDIERLSRLAYPECPYEIRDKIACSQFVTAVTDHFIRRTLQMEGITSLHRAVERAKALRIIQGEGYAREKGKFDKTSSKGEQKELTNNERKEAGEIKGQNGKERKEQRGSWRGSRFSASRGECWTCGKTGHFRSECPEEKGNAA